MTDTTTFQTTPAIAEKLAGIHFGRVATNRGNGVLAFHASKADTRQFAEMIQREERAAAATSDAATPRQISYLLALIDRDPGEASNYGLTAANVHNLTKARASQMIDALR